MPDAPTPAQLDELRFKRDAATRLLRELALESTWIMATEVMFPRDALKYYWEPLHKPICDKLDSATEGSNIHIKIARESMKTVLFTVCLATRLICKYPNIRILVMSALDDTAKAMAKLIKRQFTYNDAFRKIFPDKCIEPNTQFGTAYEFTHPHRTTVGLLTPTLKAAYIGAPLIGHRFDIVLCDDLIEDKHVSTPEQAKKSITEFTDLIPLLATDSKMRNIFVYGTPKAYNDVYAQIENRALDDAGVWTVIRHAALENDKGEPDINGTPILPNYWTRDKLMQRLEQYKADPAKGESAWWREYMITIVPPGEEKFNAEWFNTWVPRLPSNIAWSGIAVDKATKDEQVLFKGDFMVYLCGHFDTYGHLYLSHGMRSDAWKSQDSYKNLLAMSQQARGVYNIVKEKVGDDSWFGGAREYFNRMNTPITLYPVSVRQLGKKAVRIIDGVQGPAMQRRIHFVEGFPMDIHKILVEELTHIGQWSHDDAADTLALFFHPDIKIQPQPRAAHKWVPPVSRPVQVGTQFSNPGLMARRVQVAESKQPLQSKFGTRILNVSDIMQDDEPPWFKP